MTTSQDWWIDTARIDPQAAQAAIEALLPAAKTRRAVADFYAESIGHAHSVSPSCWSLTLFTNAICLNVGQVRVLDVNADSLTMYMQGPQAPRAVAGVSLLDSPKSSFYSAVTVPSFRAQVQLERLTDLPSTFRVAHNQFIASAGAKKRISPFKDSHSPAVLSVLRTLLGRQVPVPAWQALSDSDVDFKPSVGKEDDEDWGFGDSETNREVETAAVDHVTESYRVSGWKVVSVEREKCGFDLLCTKAGAERHVEVKGCSGEEVRFIITAKEYAAAFSDPLFRVAVVVRALQESREATEFTGKQLQDNFDYRPIQYSARYRGG